MHSLDQHSSPTCLGIGATSRPNIRSWVSPVANCEYNSVAGQQHSVCNKRNTSTVHSVSDTTDCINSCLEFLMVAELCLTRGISKQQQWTTGRGLDPRNTGGSSTRHNKHLHTTMAASADDESNSLGSNTQTQTQTPTYDGNYATYEEWKDKFTAHMGLQDPFFSRMFRLAEAAAQQVTEAQLRQAATTLEEAEAWGSNSIKASSMLWSTWQTGSSSHPLQATSTWDWTRGTPTTQHEVCTAGRNKKHRIPHKALEASIWQQQLWGVILQVGVWTQQAWKRQQHPTTRPSQDCSLHEWNTFHLHFMAGATPTYIDIRAAIMGYCGTTAAFSRLQQSASSSVANKTTMEELRRGT